MDQRGKDKLCGLRQLQYEADRLLLELMGADRILGQAASAFRPNADVYLSKADNAAIVKLELAGIDPHSIVLEVDGRALLIRGVRADQDAHDKVYHQMEVSYGPFERQLLLPVEVDSSRAQACYEGGFLRIELPLPRREGARRIPIQIPEESVEPVRDSTARPEEA